MTTFRASPTKKEDARPRKLLGSRLTARGWVILIGVGLILLMLGVEGFARYGLQLGAPVLTVRHPTIEYMMKPNQDTSRFGNRQRINAYGMRSDNFPKHKTDPDELRVMIFGDSVLNGGNLTDHEKLATTLLQRKLAVEGGRLVVVGNISAGSWGPENLLAYTQEYGFFDADVILLVFSSHDYADSPTFGPLDPNTHPTKNPFSATTEGINRYLPRYLPFWPKKSKSVSVPPPTEKEIVRNLTALATLLDKAKDTGAKVILFQHWERHELIAQKPDPGHGRIRAVAEAAGIPCIDFNDTFSPLQASGTNLYRDGIHPNLSGQAVMADVFYQAIQPVAAVLKQGEPAQQAQVAP